MKSDILLRTRLTTLEGALSDRGHISALEGALSVLGLGDAVTRVTNIGGPLQLQRWQWTHLPSLTSVLKSLVRRGEVWLHRWTV